MENKKRREGDDLSKKSTAYLLEQAWLNLKNPDHLDSIITELFSRNFEDAPPSKKISELSNVLLSKKIKNAEWFRLLAAKGFANAQYTLGLCYHLGKGGVKKDLKEALRWYHQAAINGDNYAKYIINCAKNMETDWMEGADELVKALIWEKKLCDNKEKNQVQAQLDSFIKLLELRNPNHYQSLIQNFGEEVDTLHKDLMDTGYSVFPSDLFDIITKYHSEPIRKITTMEVLYDKVSNLFKPSANQPTEKKLESTNQLTEKKDEEPDKSCIIA